MEKIYCILILLFSSSISRSINLLKIDSIIVVREKIIFGQ